MSNRTAVWYHCGRCNSLFQNHVEEPVESFFCTACGYRPFLTPSASSNATVPQSGKLITCTNNEMQSKNRLRPWFRRSRYFYFKLGTGWLLTTAIMILMIRWICNEGPQNSAPTAREISLNNPDSEEENIFLNRAGPLCKQVFFDFLSAETSEARCQLVHAPTATAARMASSYQVGSLGNIDPRMIKLEKISVLHTPVGRAIESYWKTSEGRLLDAMFLEEGGEWRLDWDHYVKSSDFPWPLFLAGRGEAIGEFRLLARERLEKERETTPFLGLSLYEPRFGSPQDPGFQSPEFLVERTTPNGKRLVAAFALAKSGKRVFNVNLPSIYPEGLIPIRLKIHRFEENSERRFEIEEIVACHWYSINDTGVEISDLSETHAPADTAPDDHHADNQARHHP